MGIAPRTAYANLIFWLFYLLIFISFCFIKSEAALESLKRLCRFALLALKGNTPLPHRT
jgi:hypothetical protein